ncbi:2-amino-4-hydroxy-6-hydroxymethyldihydropteridine diphosphokinase [Bacteroides oleiciplenus]|uniref:2-amino-4-hydroxy-6-hydroxymethyldihydropteridine pyrophosphokinase n=2 Tax=Bacteroides oleiciplenus TaxID=626931 RepID=K9E676_9BACE|nr:2-amino-4-hydroxy-6-hydroxymethyldihydropteridine diphosphokinase [Bacteroides oleiciplenus]EKU92694.1 2-amino-4-hydroxy-6-hydroxymethyldihydropteridine pyrophosphokinase [Bacteroides oleiciplenus YIT 12058]RGN37197.1 2-amino-4-hydroxy-6-hydroxymethyldihydropteridine diphosphokinase [Bacteroides oleiciplenus]
MVYTISIGSNERRKENLSLARERLKELFPSICFSTEEETKPLYFRRTSLFSNQVARFVSDNNAMEVISHLKAIEKEAGRMPEEKKQEIVRLDIDLLSCDDTVYKPEDLKRDYICRGLKELRT